MLMAAATGHRPSKLDGEGVEGERCRWLRRQMRGLLSVWQFLDPDLVLISGMAQGFDTLFVEEGIDLGIPFVAAIPFHGQEKRWPGNVQAYYHHLLSRAQLVVDISGGATRYSPQLFLDRNTWMADRSGVAVAAWDGSSGGTADGYRKLMAREVPLWRLNPATFQMQVLNTARDV